MSEKLIAGAPGAYDGFWLAESLSAGQITQLIHVSVDDRALARSADILALAAPNVERIIFPAWDCLPYDRVGPNATIAAKRIDALYRLATRAPDAGPVALLTTTNALLQRVPAPEAYLSAGLTITTGESLNTETFLAYAAANGFERAETVMEPGEYALRGGLIDVFPPSRNQPVRLDLFGDDVERIRSFDPLTQISTEPLDQVVLTPVSEVLLTEEAITRFRTTYRDLFGSVRDSDELYAAISAGRRQPGMEHWLPLFTDALVALPDYLPEATLSLGDGAQDAITLRLEQIVDYFAARCDLKQAGTEAGEGIYNPLPPDQLYLMDHALQERLAQRAVIRFSAFDERADGEGTTHNADVRLMRNFAAEARSTGSNAFEIARDHTKTRAALGDRIILACASTGSVNRLARLLKEHSFADTTTPATWAEALTTPVNVTALLVLDLDQGFSAPGLMVIAEPDLLGQRLARRSRRGRPADAFIGEVTQLTEGTLVVHLEHGIGRYDGLETLEVAVGGTRKVAHDCLRLIYGGGDKLFVPVENMDVLTRYGEDQGSVTLDRLGGAAWQARKSKLKGRIREMAGELLRVAANRALAKATPMIPHQAAFEEFCARFPYTETEDQQAAINDTLADLSQDRPMDRLICGDVGFGKTEVALRATYAAALNGSQVAIVVPTTLLARQHYETFRERFQGLPVRITQLSRLVTPKEAEDIKDGLARGEIDIVVGTHAVLAESLRFLRLGLLIIDEEQHFGVIHKERLKKLRADVHVLTLTATPIPRTLQLALTGVKDLSIIASPPVDRLAVRTFTLPYDPLVIREAIKREMHRGGQCFYVCPRIADIGTVEAQLTEIAPDARRIAVHGQMPSNKLEAAMQDFFERRTDILISTNIIESGLDMPNVNTIIVHRADMFGLAQLYQLRGRVGRSKTRAYAYLTLPPRRQVTPAAAKRLAVMQTLDALGAGFSLASHDLDIRGAGNLLGDQQSGHIREVGIELYQQMLEETVAELKGGTESEGEWTPQINVDVPVLIPENYVADLGVRLSLYRRISSLVDRNEVDSFAAELIDRFGPLPIEVENLIQIIALKQACRAAGVEKVDAGPMGCNISFYQGTFANAPGLIAAISKAPGTMKVRPDQTLVIARHWPTPEARVKGLDTEIGALARIAREGETNLPKDA
jgi:transcription-repair coupling factor (superfamily II helicase)